MIRRGSLLAAALVLVAFSTAAAAAGQRPVEVVIYRAGECGAWRDALSTVRAAARDLGVKARVRVVVVRSRDEAERLGFHGSPSVLVGGVDVEGPEVEKRPSSFG